MKLKTKLIQLSVGISFLMPWGLWGLKHLKIGFYNDNIPDSIKIIFIVTTVLIFCIQFLYIFISFFKFLKPLVFTIYVFLLFFLLIETAFYFSACFSIVPKIDYAKGTGWGWFNKESAKYDQNNGYLFHKNKCRIVKIVNGELIFDNEFETNNKGFISSLNYTKKKTNKYRVLVFGDSFTGAGFIENNWPNKVNSFLSKNNKELEIYSFALDGTGLLNWMNTFKHEIINKYEFDAIIFSVFPGDLQRNFYFLHHENNNVYSGYLKKPLSESDFGKSNLTPYKSEYSSITPDSILNMKVRSVKNKKFNLLEPDLYFTMFVINRVQLYHEELKLIEYKNSQYDKTHDFSTATKTKLDYFKNYCNTNNKQLVFTTVPDIMDVRSSKKGQQNEQNTNLESYCKNNKILFIDGLKPFMKIENSNLKELFLRYDWHWNQKGSDIYANHLYNSLFKNYNQNEKLSISGE